MPQCRICWEPCDEKTPCACVGFAHAACLERWIAVSGRTDCEVCRSPYRIRTQYEWRITWGHQGFEVGDAHDHALIVAILFGFGAFYVGLLWACEDWLVGWGSGLMMHGVLMCMFLPVWREVRLENILFWWKACSFAALAAMYVITGCEEALSDSPLTRSALLWMDGVLLCAMFTFRTAVGLVRGMRRRVVTMSPDILDTTDGI